MGKVLRRVLTARKSLSLRSISENTGIPYPTLHAWKDGRPPKNLQVVKVLADYLGLSLLELLFDERQSSEETTRADRYQITVKRVRSKGSSEE